MEFAQQDDLEEIVADHPRPDIEARDPGDPMPGPLKPV